MRRLGVVEITLDELEALRLADLEGFSHEEAGRLMNVSRATFGRIVASARKKTADALIGLKAVAVDLTGYEEADLLVECKRCGITVYAPPEEPPPRRCPSCGVSLHRKK